MEKTPTSLLSKIIVQAIAMVVFVIVPIVITLVVPLTDIEFQKTGTTASISLKRYVLIFIPWQTKEVLNVKEVRADVTLEKRYQDTSENRRKGNKGTSFSTGQLVIISDGPEVIVQAAPELATQISKQFQQFLTSENAAPVKLSVYASWSLSYVVGGFATFFAAFYLFGALVSIVISPFK
jgi:hypothetical protein